MSKAAERHREQIEALERIHGAIVDIRIPRSEPMNDPIREQIEAERTCTKADEQDRRLALMAIQNPTIEPPTALRLTCDVCGDTRAFAAFADARAVQWQAWSPSGPDVLHVVCAECAAIVSRGFNSR
jgi:hypothetical protein